MAIVLRTVSWDLEVSEHFVGLYNTKDATADTLTGLLVNTLEDISKGSLNLKNCRARSYEGGANMKGHLTGVQTRVRGIQPKAIFSYCSGHMLNLVLKDAAEKVDVLATAIEFAHALGNFCKDSVKRKLRFQNTPINAELFDELVGEDDETQTTSRRGATIRPLCPTRWVMRQASLDSILCNYERIFTFLDEVPEHSNDAKISAKAAGLLTKAEEFQSFFGLRGLHQLFGSDQPIHKYMQSPHVSVSHVKDLIDMLDTEYALKAGVQPLNLSGDALMDQSVEKVETFYREIVREAEVLDLHPPVLRTSRADRRRIAMEGGNMPTFEAVARITKSWYSDKYIQVYATASKSIRVRYDRTAIAMVSSAEHVLTQPGVNDFMQLENVMTHWGSEDLVINFHDYLLVHPEKLYDPKLEGTSPKSKPFDISKFDGIVSVMRQWPVLRDMYPVMTALVRLLLVIPATSCEAERSFSTLRRLKTYLRSTMA